MVASSPPLVERDAATPLVSFQVVLRGGAAADPFGLEGVTRHAALLARRGIAAPGKRMSRTELDDALDQLGASLDVRLSRDATTVAGTCLSRNLDPVIDMCAGMLHAPAMEQEEHDKLVRETRALLDDLREDDEQLAARFFARYAAPGSRYSRTTMGTDDSLGALELDDLVARFRATAVTGNAIIGFSGDIDADRAAAVDLRLRAHLGESPAPPLPDVTCASPAGPRVYVIDKPQRTQSQLLLGHTVPRYGSDAHTALIPIETIFGGTFTARLNQQVRVKRGWSYGAGCDLERARGDYWFSIYLAPAADVTVPALRLVLDMFDELHEAGITAAELDFAKSYLAGRMPFAVATARQRLHVAIRERLFELPAGYRELLASQLAALSLDEVNTAAARWLRPDQLCIVIVATASDMLPRLEAGGFGGIEVIPFDSY